MNTNNSNNNNNTFDNATTGQEIIRGINGMAQQLSVITEAMGIGLNTTIIANDNNHFNETAGKIYFILFMKTI